MEKETTITRVFNVPCEKVWQAWTDPEQLAKWWGPRGVTNPESKVDLRIGGEIYIVMLAGKELGPLAGQRWPMRGIFREIKEKQKLVFSNQAVDENGEVLIDGMTTVIFEDTKEKDSSQTKLTLTTGGKGMVPQAEQMLAGMEQGWRESLDKLDEFLK